MPWVETDHSKRTGLDRAAISKLKTAHPQFHPSHTESMCSGPAKVAKRHARRAGAAPHPFGHCNPRGSYSLLFRAVAKILCFLVDIPYGHGYYEEGAGHSWIFESLGGIDT